MSERLDRIENAIADLAARQTRTDEQINGLIQVIRDFAARSDADRSETNTQIENLIGNSQAVSKRLERIEQGLETTTQQQQDNTVAVAQLITSQAEATSQIQVLIEEGREHRNWLRAAQENIQSVFAEIQRLWQAVNAA